MFGFESVFVRSMDKFVFVIEYMCSGMKDKFGFMVDFFWGVSFLW